MSVKDSARENRSAWLDTATEMGRRVLGMDWSRTPLGPVQNWSPALRTMTSILLANRFPMLLWWGPDSISIYNDAYIPVLGAKHPSALGLPVRECWSEIYDILEPLIKTPLNGGPPTWSEDLELVIRRHGFFEETHWTVAYSPVPDETATNGIGGVLATVTEITAQIVGERRSSLLRQLAARVAEVSSPAAACRAATTVFADYPKDVPFALVYLIDPDGRTARLTSVTGIERGSVACPELVDVSDDTHDERHWLMTRAVRTEAPQLVEGPAAQWAGPLPSGLAVRALTLPIESSLPHRPAGVLVLGLSPQLELNASHRGFAELVASQMARAIVNTRAYEAERQKAEELAKLDRAKTIFFSNVSHELRTPLTLMLGPLRDVLDETEALAAEQRDQLEAAHRNAQRLLKLVNSLLDFSRIEAGRTEVSFERTDVGTLTSEIASAFRSLVERAGLTLTIDSPPLADPVCVDPEMWEKIVSNLLSNAFKYTLDGEIRIRVAVEGEELSLTVSDTGSGIDAEHLPHVFERFYRVEGASGRSSEGTGIGLALVRELAHLHGGTASVESERGKGSTFTVRVPTRREQPASERARTTPVPTPTAVVAQPFLHEAASWIGEAPPESAAQIRSHVFATSDSNATRILVADDNADMRAYLDRLLRPLGTVESVCDGREALAAIEREMPDLIVSDVMMPNVDGFELMRVLREQPRTATLPIVLLSARAGEEARVEGANHGADDYIVKPFAARELAARVQTQLQLSRTRRQYAAALEQGAERFRALVTASSDVVYRMSPDWSEMLHLVGRDFIADTRDPSRSWIEKYIPDEERPRVVEVMQRAIRDKQMFELEHRVVQLDGSVGWTFSRAVPLFGADGEIVEWFGTARDITARKRAEQALRDSEERFRTLFESIDEGFCIIEVIFDEHETAVDYRFIEMNPAFLEQTGLVDAKGRTIREMVPEHEDYWFETYGEIALTGKPARFEREARYLVPPRWFDVYAFRYGEAKNRQIGVLFNDIGDRKRAAEAMQRANTVLEESDRRKNEFLAVLSHELRNPLAPIVNGLNILDVVEPGSKHADRAKQIIGRQVTQLANLVNDLLDVTRITSNKVHLHKEHVELYEIVRRVVEDHRSLFERVGVKLGLTPKSGAVPVFADRTRMAQVVGNLLQNAAKFTSRGNLTRVDVAVENDEAVVRVSDNGVGIAPETLLRLFEPFAQADQTLDRSKGGLGLGLSLVKGLVELHGGTVLANSRGLGHGTEVVVRLPLDANAPQRQSPASVRPPSASRRILIIEDNVDSADTLSDLLTLRGHDVDVAYNGPDGIAKAVQSQPDVVLCDIGLPGMDGYDVARALSASDVLRETSFVALSGYALPEDLQRAVSAGFHSHLTKPPKLEELELVLAKLPSRFGHPD